MKRRLLAIVLAGVLVFSQNGVVLAAENIWHENLNETVPGLTALVKEYLDRIQNLGMLEAVKTIL